jgi:hypothetical protein
LNYQIPDKTFAVNPAGSVPTITFQSNQSSTHFHVQVQSGAGWQMVVDDTGLGKAVAIQGGGINSAADFAGRRFFWDITLVAQDNTNPVEAVLQVTINQDGKQLLKVNDDHFFTGQESYYEYLNAH